MTRSPDMKLLSMQGHGAKRHIVHTTVRGETPEKDTIGIYHFMDSDTDWRESTEMVHAMLWQALTVTPAAVRKLYLDIHPDHLTGKDWDEDAFRLQFDVVCKSLMACLTEATLPMAVITNGRGQVNYLPPLDKLVRNAR